MMSQNRVPFLYSTHNFSSKETSARLISDLANPLILPFLTFFAVGWMTRLSTSILLLLLGTAFIFYTAIPFGTALYLLKQKHISSLDAPEQKTRNRLYGYSLISSALGSILLYALFYQNHPFLASVALVYLINPFIGFAINLKWKISVHAASLAIAGNIILFYCITETSIGVSFAVALSLVLLFILSLMVWARNHLRVHSLAELIGGAVVGTALTLVELGLIF